MTKADTDNGSLVLCLLCCHVESTNLFFSADVDSLDRESFGLSSGRSSSDVIVVQFKLETDAKSSTRRRRQRRRSKVEATSRFVAERRRQRRQEEAGRRRHRRPKTENSRRTFPEDESAALHLLASKSRMSLRFLICFNIFFLSATRYNCFCVFRCFSFKRLHKYRCRGTLRNLELAEVRGSYLLP